MKGKNRSEWHGDRRLLSCKTAGVLLDLSERQVRELVWRKHLPAIKIGRHLRVPLRALENLIGKCLSGASEDNDSSDPKD